MRVTLERAGDRSCPPVLYGDFCDGQAPRGRPSHRYAKPGLYTVRVGLARRRTPDGLPYPAPSAASGWDSTPITAPAMRRPCVKTARALSRLPAWART